MKTNKLWSIIMMLALVFGTTFTFSSCSDDDDDVIDPTTCSDDDDDDDVKKFDPTTLYKKLVGTWYVIFDEDERTEDEWGYEVTWNADYTVITKWYTHSGELTETETGKVNLEEEGMEWWTDGDFIYAAIPEENELNKFYFSGDTFHAISYSENGEEEIVYTRGNLPFNRK